MPSSILKTIITEAVLFVTDKLLDRVFRKKEESKSKDSSTKKTAIPDRIHPWRPCPFGQSWVTTHPLTIPKSEHQPEQTVTRRGHCRTNPGHKEIFHPEEFLEIAATHFPDLTNTPELLPTPERFDFTKRKGGFEDGFAGFFKNIN